MGIGRIAHIVDIRLLGTVEAVDGHGVVIDLGGPQPRALVALLARHIPETVSKELIADTFWPDRRDDDGAAIHVAINRVRAALGKQAVVTAGGGYRLSIPPSNVDLTRFRLHAKRGRQLVTLGHPGKATESFRQALAQWRGSALGDVRKLDFAERWAQQLEEERVSVVEDLLEAELECGEHDLVVGELSGLVDLYPYRERLWRLLMLALYRSGRQAEALRAFARLRDLLTEELGVDPSPDLVDLEERILLHDPALVDVGELDPPRWPEEQEHVSFSPGQVIFEEGTSSDAVYWIEEGIVSIHRRNDAGEEERLAELGPGHYFGELASLLGTRRTASAVAMTAVTVTLHNRETFRQRLGAERARREADAEPTDALWDLVRRGQYLEAYDRGVTLIDGGDSNVEIRYVAVLALARSGATALARKRYANLGLGSVDRRTVSPDLAEDIAALAARLDKDMALANDGDRRRGWARRSAEAYARANAASPSAYLASNAATMWMLAGESGRAREAAERALDLLSAASAPGDVSYWHHVTEAEAALILNEENRAREALERASEVSSANFASRATTVKQLELICETMDLDRSVLSAIRNPNVVHYCGHRILAPGTAGRFPAEEEGRIRRELVEHFERLDVGFGFGSLAAGADILAAEVLLERNAELHVILPFSRAEFVQASVADAGADWVPRFDRCLATAAQVEFSSNSEHLGDPVLFDFCSRIAMGASVMRARFLETSAFQVAVWDGVESDGLAGTAVDVAAWRDSGRETFVIPIDAAPDGSVEAEEPRRFPRTVRPIVFADFAGFSALTDSQVITFQERIMGGVANVIEPFRTHLLSGRTWGDGLNLVFDDVAVAADCALALQEAVKDLDFEQIGLGSVRGVRIAAHATPVFDGEDPVSGQRLFYGAGVTHTARIEPRTPEGEIYTTQAFATLALLAAGDSFDCQYVGTLPTAKGYGNLPLFALRRR